MAVSRMSHRPGLKDRPNRAGYADTARLSDAARLEAEAPADGPVETAEAGPVHHQHLHRPSPATAAGRKTEPTPRTVWMTLGPCSSSFLRSALTWTSTTLSRRPRSGLRSQCRS